MKRVFIICALFAVQSVVARDYFVAKDGSDRGTGTIDSPFATIKKASSVVAPGDVCYIREGEYNEELNLRALGSPGAAPITFEAYRDEKVVLSGATSLENVKWQKHEGSIYKAQFKRPIWQLFVDGQSMSAARWPNANWDDGSLWDRTKSMIYPEDSDVKGVGSYTNSQLKELDFSLEDGGIIVVNSGSFKSYQSYITKHEAGSTKFEYDKSRVKGHGTSKDDYKRHGYFLEGKLGLLDTAGEWFYDTKSNTVYLWCLDGESPKGKRVMGKSQAYFFNAQECHNIAIRGVDFFGTTVNFVNSTGIVVEDCDFLYPSYSRRMLGDLKMLEVTSFMNKIGVVGNHSVINCSFAYGDGPALSARTTKIKIDNCDFREFDYSCIFAGGFMFDLGRTKEMIFRRNTATITGNSEMLQVGSQAIVELNDLSYCGLLQTDGSLVQVSVGGQDGTVLRNNWVHNSERQGLRFDNVNQEGAPFGKNCTAHHNVAWETDRIFFKGDEHFLYNNVSYDNNKNDLIISNNTKISGFNYKTITRNNLAGSISGDINKPAKVSPVPGVADHNWAGSDGKEDIRTQLRDPDNRDYRPKAGSEVIDAGALIAGKDIAYEGKAPDMGAYEFGAENYWIAGRRMSKASVAIPLNGTKTAKIDADMMWLEAYGSSESIVYFGESEGAMKKCSTQKSNIFTPPAMKLGATYFWRVDSVVDGDVVEGDVWSFTVESKN